MAEVVEHRHFSNPSLEPVRIKLERGQKGGYAWEISVSGPDWQACILHIDEANEALKSRYLHIEANEALK